MKARGARFRTWLAAAGLAALTCGLSLGCEGFLGSSKVAQGQRYQSEDSRFDPYFDSVHEQQVAAAQWPEEKKAARRPLVNALALTPGASDDSIVSAARARVRKQGAGGKLDVATGRVTPVGGAGDPPLFAAVEETVRLELDRARKLKAAGDKLEDMARRGDELKTSADKEFQNRGAEKADQQKTDKRNEIRRELGGAVSATRKLAREATSDSREAQDFVDDLGSAIEAGEASSRRRRPHEARPLPPAPQPPPRAEEPRKEEPREEKPKPVRADKKPAEKPAPKPAKPAERPAPRPEKPAPRPAEPADKPAPAKPAPPPEEVFNP